MPNVALPTLVCPTYGVLGAPTVGPGTGPHVAKLTCRSCGRFVKWAPRVLVQSSLVAKDITMTGSVNRCILVGLISKYGVEVRYAPSGSPCASFMLALTEPGQDGRGFTTLVPCECWGKKAEVASEIEPGTLVLFEGRLQRRKKGEGTWELVVSGFEMVPVVGPLALTGSAN